MKKILSLLTALLVMYVGLSQAKAIVVTDSICTGTSITIGYSYPTGVWYLWNTGASTIQITVAPMVNTVYTVCILDASCATIAQDTFNIIIKPISSVWITGDALICANETTTLVAHGASSYLWNTGSTNSSIQVCPMSTTNYTVVGWDANGYSAMANFLVTVQTLPLTYTITGNTSYCPGQQGSIIGLDGSEIDCWYKLWKNGVGVAIVNGTGYPISFGPQLEGSYTVSGFKNTLGCSAPMYGTIVVTRGASPIVNITTNNPNICAGESANLTATGTGISFLWSTGETTQTIIVTPTATTMYTVTATGIGGCSTTSSFTITVQASLVVTLTLVQNSFCTDVHSAILSGGYPSGGIYTGTGIFDNIIYPPVIGVGTYLVTYTYVNQFGTASATDLLTINPIPAIMFTNVTFGVYVDTPAFDLMTYVSPKGGIFSGPGMIGSFFYPAMAGSGTHMISYTYTHPITGCAATQIQYIPVGALGVDDDIDLTIKDIVIFPNPGINQLNLHGIDTKEIHRVSIINALGKVVYTTETITSEMQLDISNYPSGIYIISFMNTEGISLGKRFMKI